jgi:hypothetical protein
VEGAGNNAVVVESKVTAPKIVAVVSGFATVLVMLSSKVTVVVSGLYCGKPSPGGALIGIDEQVYPPFPRFAQYSLNVSVMVSANIGTAANNRMSAATRYERFGSAIKAPLVDMVHQRLSARTAFPSPSKWRKVL